MFYSWWLRIYLILSIITLVAKKYCYYSHFLFCVCYLTDCHSNSLPLQSAAPSEAWVTSAQHCFNAMLFICVIWVYALTFAACTTPSCLLNAAYCTPFYRFVLILLRILESFNRKYAVSLPLTTNRYAFVIDPVRFTEFCSRFSNDLFACRLCTDCWYV